MAGDTLNINVQVQANGEAISIVPNTLTYSSGKGDKSVMVASYGQALTTIYGDNLKNAISTIKFKVYPTSDIIKTMQQLQDNKNANTLTLIFPDTSDTFTMTEAAITNDPDIPASPDEQIEYTFQGTAVV